MVDVVTCSKHKGVHVYNTYKEHDQDLEEECTDVQVIEGFVHECSEVWSIGWYLCTCGEPWLNQAQHCVTQPGGFGPRNPT